MALYYSRSRRREISTSIASAVEETSSNVQQAAQGTQEVSSSMADVTQAADELSLQPTNLRSSVDDFLNPVRAA